MLIKILTLFLLACLINTQPNYQQRAIYYSEQDNVCRFGERSDQVNLIINLNDRETLRRTVRGNTGCDQWTLRYANAISPSPYLYLLNNDEKMNFHQEAIRKYSFGVLSHLIQNVTMENPATMNGVQYNCTILGDGTLQHFGIDLGYDPAEIYVRCLSKTTSVNDNLQV